MQLINEILRNMDLQLRQFEFWSDKQMMNKQKFEKIRITKRPSKPKIPSEKLLNLTISGKMFERETKQPKLPPLPSVNALRRTSTKLTSPEVQKPETKERIQTETTSFTESTLFQSYYMTMSKNWIKPSDYIKDIKELNLLNEDDIDVKNYEIKLSEGNSKNMEKIESLFSLVEKWIGILKRALFYVTSQKTTSDKLSEEIKFWKVLSKKFDQLEYEFNDKKTTELMTLMTRIIKTNPTEKKLFDEFIHLKNQAISMTHPIKRLYLCLQETVTGRIQKFQESSDIGESLTLLKNIMISLRIISQEQAIMTNRMEVIYRKMDLCLIQKLLAAPLYPHQLASISSVHEKYNLIDRALSFYSNFLSILEEQENRQLETNIERATYTRQVLLNLMQILSYFQFLYNKKDVKEFSKLFVNNIHYNIYDFDSKQEWAEYMDVVEKSMEHHHFEP